MRIAIIIPSREQKEQAGVRIRYQRIASIIILKGGALDVISIQDMSDLTKYKYDLYVISKCYDCRAIVLAKSLIQQGSKVCIDIFDDYFSQVRDSRFIRLRYWLKSILRYCSFVLCSTDEIADLINTYNSNLPVHIYNDPADKFSIEQLCENLDRKLENIQQSMILDIAWFGIGDNPDFPVGLQDLIAYSHELLRLSNHGFQVKLHILTNLRSLTSETLHKLSNIAIPYQIEEWTLEKEHLLLEKCYISFLPVNAQNFSRAKSLNRALTALIHGTQVFSAGYPLYQQLNNFIYRDSDSIINDLRRASPLLRRSTASNFLKLIETLASPNIELEKLMDFISAIKYSFDGLSSRLAIIHGKESSGDIHKFSQYHGCLSVGSPYATTKLNFDVRFIFLDNYEMLVLISRKKISLTNKKFTSKFNYYGQILNTEYMSAKVSDLIKDFISVGAISIKYGALSSQLSVYSRLMADVAKIVELLFPNVQCLFSEQTKKIAWTVSS